LISALTPRQGGPSDQQEDSANHGTNQARTLPGPVPAQTLPQPCGDKGTRHTQQGGQDKTRWLFVAGHKEFGDNASHKSNQNGPQDIHVYLLSVMTLE
jgi:hypothetical protein